MDTNSTKVNFTASNPNFIARLLIFALSILALIGVQFPTGAEELTEQITTTISTSGFYSVIGLLAISVIMPIYNLIKMKPKITLSSIIGNPNFWIYAGTFFFGILVLVGINIPEGTAEALVGAIYAKDWAGLFTIALANIIDPLIRFFKDRNAKNVAAYNREH